MKVVVYLLVIAWCTLACCSCGKEKITSNPDAALITPVDSIYFDTVFTAAGSATQVFTIVNPNSSSIVLDAVRLSGGAISPFHINVDGSPGPLVQNVVIAGNDSAYVFVSVNINPGTSSLPFVVSDSIAINYNGNTKWVQLSAYGQNAHFINNETMQTNQVWNNDLPYVVLGQLTVAPAATLTINEGCKVFFHANAPLLVQGTLRVLGKPYDSTRVVFTGDRLDDPYHNFPASFPGLIFTETSNNNLIEYATIKNAYQAVVCAGAELTMKQSVIDNAYDAGVLAINASISATNLLVSNCGRNLSLVGGGNYHFTHCTVAAFSNPFIAHKKPVLQVSNFLLEGNNVAVQPLQASFTNCIFWGDANTEQSEVVVEKKGNAAFDVTFTNVLWPLNTTLSNTNVNGVNIQNEPPLFQNTNPAEGPYNFRLQPNSPAIGKGINAGVAIDLDGKARPAVQPSLGAYEAQ